MPSYKVVWKGTKSELDQISDLMTEVHFPPADAVSLTKDDATTDDSSSSWRLDAYFEAAPEIPALSEFLRSNDIVLVPVLEELPDRDWVAHSLEGLGIVRCGRFVLYGIHDADKLPGDDGDIPVRIDANQAFGTGHHPTTSGCLTVLNDLAHLQPENVLDLGTGSAVLAIAAAKLWNTNILATDIDPVSVDIAAENTSLNHVENVTFRTAEGFDHDVIRETAPFDFVFANILAGPLIELAPEVASHSSDYAHVIVAGLLARQEASVKHAYERAGFELTYRHDDDTWPVLLFKKV